MAGASSSAAGNICFHCKTVTATFKNGWRLSCGDLANFCDRCGSAYENGTFCVIFHMDSDGWRDCLICSKMLHCGCIASAGRIIFLDFGGICCLECSNNSKLMEEVQNVSSKACPQYWYNLRAQLENSCRTVELSVDSEEPMTDSASCCVKSSGLIHSQRLPNVSKGEKLKFLPDSSSGIIPFFEKILTASDTDIKKPRLVIPKKYAKAYFPEIFKPKGIRLEVQDTTGRNWELNYRYWLNPHGNIYVLEGLKDYMILMQWQPGDIVTFSLMQPKGKLLMGTRKASNFSPALEAEMKTMREHLISEIDKVESLT